MDATTKQLVRRQVASDKQRRSQDRRNAKKQAALAAEAKREKAAVKARELAMLQPLFDAQAARIGSLVTEEMWLSRAKPVVFRRERPWHLRKNVLPLLSLDTVYMAWAHPRQLYYRVFLRKDGQLRFEPSQQGEATIPVEGDKYCDLAETYDYGCNADLWVVLDFLELYTP